MTEKALRNYFEDLITLGALIKDLKGSQDKTGYDTKSYYIDPIEDEGEYYVTREHLLKICTATIEGDLSSNELNSIAFCLMASNYFIWDLETKDGEIIDSTLFDWDNPEIGFPITKENLEHWKKYLETGVYNLKA